MVTSSIVICTRNRKQDLLHCLQSIIKQTQQPQELIIVDSSDSPLYRDPEFTHFFVPAHFGSISLHYIHSAPGLTYQRNIGIGLAKQEIIFFIDDDVFLEATYVQEMLAVFGSCPNYAGGMGAVTNIPPKIGGWQRAVRTSFALQRDYASGNFTWSGMPTHAYGKEQFQEVEVLGGCNMAFRTHVLRKHRFDEKLVRYAFMEDCDMSYRVSREYPLFYNPKARLQHFNSPLARDKVIDNRAMVVKNYSYLFFKNFYPTNKLRVVGYAWSMTGLFVEAVLIRNKEYVKGYVKGLREFLNHC